MTSPAPASPHHGLANPASNLRFTDTNGSREYYARLYDFAPVGYLTLSKAGCILKINLAGARLLGRPRGRLYGQPLRFFIAKADQKKYLHHLSLCRQQKALRLSTELWLHPNESGRANCVELISSIADGIEADPLAYNTILIEITRRREAEIELHAAHESLERRVQERTTELTLANSALHVEIGERRRIELALRQSEEKFRLLIESSKDYAFYMLDHAGRVATWNASAERLLGHAAKDILGRQFTQFYPRGEVREGKPIRLLQLAWEQGRAEDEGWRVRRDGSRFWANAIITALVDESRRLHGFSIVLRDVTERRRTQETLRASERNLADFFANAPLGLMWVNPRDAKIQQINQKGLELLGCTLNECLRRPLRSFYADRSQALADLKRLARHETLADHRVPIRGQDGTIRHVLVDANGLWEGNRMVHSRWFLRDITQRLELEREILVVAERERRRIGRDLHDDLCQQLTGIEFLSQTLAGRLSAASRVNAGRAREIARLVRQATVHTRELAHGLSPVDLETRGLTGALQELAARTRKVFKVDCRFRCHKSGLKYNPDLGIHLYRIAQEAVANALKHGRAGRVDIGLTRNRDRLVLAIKDNGVGMPKKLSKRKGMGVHVMHYRAGAISGSLVFQRNPEGGTTVACSVSDPASNLQPTAGA